MRVTPAIVDTAATAGGLCRYDSGCWRVFFVTRHADADVDASHMPPLRAHVTPAPVRAPRRAAIRQRCCRERCRAAYAYVERDDARSDE